MVRIRLTRLGAKKKPFYRVIVADSRAPRDGSNIEQIGFFDPMTTPPVIKLDLARVDHWIGVGAQPSDTVRDLIKKARASSVSA
jgi:small subunit ribosomal protein S16